MFRNTLYFLMIAAFLGASCEKFLDAKPDKSLAVPSNLKDLQAILDYEGEMNATYPYIGEVMSDNYYITTNDWKALSANILRGAYTWEPPSLDLPSLWTSNVYKIVYNANVVLDNIDKVAANDPLHKRSIKGSALFFRSYAIFRGAQIFAMPYTKDSAQIHLGIPITTSSDVNTTYTRPTLSEMYEKIIEDLKEAGSLLPDVGYPLTRPGRSAVFGTLSYIYLITGDYEQASRYADSCLMISDQLMDYNNIPPGTNPFPRFNTEVTFQARISAIPFLAPARAKVDSNLYNSYSDDDLRKSLFYSKNSDGTYAFQGSYDANPTSAAFFCGLATDEVYLLKAESLARIGKSEEAMIWLNKLLRLRWKTNTFVDYTAGSASEALTIILDERRKELAFRGGLRWADIKRLNTESDRQITLKRIIDNIEYILPPGDLRYAYLIPDLVIDLGGIIQNPR